jgi:anti-sigma-K factor RskA
MTAMGHDRFVDAAGAYLLGALPELEEQAYERHVMACADCRDEAERLRPAVEALPRSVTPLNPPESLGRKLMQTVAAEVEEARAESPATPREGRLERALRTLRAGASRARPAVAWASAAFLLAVGIGAGYVVRGVDEPDERSVPAIVDRDHLAEGSGTLLVREDHDQATLSVHGLPALPAEDGQRGSHGADVYQLWLVRGDEVIPSSLFSVGSDGRGFAAIPEGVADADAVWVTREPAGGARAPSDPPVMRVNL